MLWVWGLIFGGAYTWRGLFLEFYGKLHRANIPCARGYKLPLCTAGIGGHTLDTLIQRDIPVVANCRPIIVILEIGTNDLTHPDVSVVAVVARLLLLVH